jgi:hypothetical protein
MNFETFISYNTIRHHTPEELDLKCVKFISPSWKCSWDIFAFDFTLRKVQVLEKNKE